MPFGGWLMWAPGSMCYMEVKSRSDESICRREGWQDGEAMRPFIRILWLVVDVWCSDHIFGMGEGRHFKFGVQINCGEYYHNYAWMSRPKWSMFGVTWPLWSNRLAEAMSVTEWLKSVLSVCTSWLCKSVFKRRLKTSTVGESLMSVAVYSGFSLPDYSKNVYRIRRNLLF